MLGARGDDASPHQSFPKSRTMQKGARPTGVRPSCH